MPSFVTKLRQTKSLYNVFALLYKDERDAINQIISYMGESLSTKEFMYRICVLVDTEYRSNPKTI